MLCVTGSQSSVQGLDLGAAVLCPIITGESVWWYHKCGIESKSSLCVIWLGLISMSLAFYRFIVFSALNQVLDCLILGYVGFVLWFGGVSILFYNTNSLLLVCTVIAFQCNLMCIECCSSLLSDCGLVLSYKAALLRWDIQFILHSSGSALWALCCNTNMSNGYIPTTTLFTDMLKTLGVCEATVGATFIF